MPFQFKRLAIPELILVKPQKFEDSRGFFVETYRETQFAENGITARFVQDNYSHSVGRVLRGLHFQKNPRAQGKLVMVITGKVFDVAVDIRRGSPTYGRWIGEILSAEDGKMLYIPPGFAHGFCVLGEQADFTYKVTAEFAADLDRGIVWNDPDIGIEWPIDQPSLSPKDAHLPRLQDADINFEYRGT
ncbi:MAG: dTDP-4-dehydrorhamnose 3,5-epimerase [Anaerolineae bacterium]|nr:dTDP-4-dehydrorhamnose 3,5-epimerase [Anaerolineae bacterium]